MDLSWAENVNDNATRAVQGVATRVTIAATVHTREPVYIGHSGRLDAAADDDPNANFPKSFASEVPNGFGHECGEGHL